MVSAVLLAAALAAPAAAQTHNVGVPRPKEYSASKEALTRAGNVALNTAVHSLLAVANGRPVVEGVRNALAISVGTEALYALNNVAVRHGLPITPAAAVLGGVPAGMHRNNVRGDAWCADLRLRYLLVSATYDCGGVRLALDATPLLGAAEMAATEAELDLAESLQTGRPTFTFTGHTERFARSAGKKIGDAIAYRELEPSPVPDLLEAYRPDDPRQAAMRARALAEARAYRRQGEIRRSQALLHEIRHTNQDEWARAMAEALDAPWYLYAVVEAGWFRFTFDLPYRMLHRLSNSMLDHHDRPWEWTAHAESDVWVPGDAPPYYVRTSGGWATEVAERRP